MSEASGRSCGGCTACCFTHEIKNFDKPAAQLCAQCEVGKGCKIYGRHPDDCRGYKCLWLMSKFPENMRPDRLGVVADFVPQKAAGSKFEILRMYEVWPGALESVYAQALLQGLMTAKCVVLLKRLQTDAAYGIEYVISPSLEAEFADEKAKAAR